MHGVAGTLDEHALQTLLRELGEAAHAHRFRVAPNPSVGAAVLAGTRVIGRGFHEVYGEAHAEVRALEAAEASGVPRDQWTALVVTLEPCSSHGNTPPCTDAVLASGIRLVVVGGLDPDPRHRGRGVELLRERGVEVLAIPNASPLELIAPHFLRWMSEERLRRPRPWTIAKWAQTLSGQLSPPEDVGEGRWISGPEALAEVQRMRARVDAVVTGVGTVVADDPRLTVRPPGVTDRPALRVVLDGALRTPPGARIFQPPAAEGESAGPVHVLGMAGASGGRARTLEAAGAHVHGLHGADRHRLELRDVQTWLWDHGARRVLLEAGPRLLASYLDAGFVDQLMVVTSDVRGGRGPSLGDWLQSHKLVERAYGELGGDAVLEGFLI